MSSESMSFFKKIEHQGMSLECDDCAPATDYKADVINAMPVGDVEPQHSITPSRKPVDENKFSFNTPKRHLRRRG